MKRIENMTFIRRTGYALANALRPRREGTLFEHFIVCGLPTTTKCSATPKKPGILYIPYWCSFFSEKLEAQVLFQWPPADQKPFVD